MNIKTENWNGHEIRLVEKEHNEWWAVLADVAKALLLSAKFLCLLIWFIASQDMYRIMGILTAINYGLILFLKSYIFTKYEELVDSYRD